MEVYAVYRSETSAKLVLDSGATKSCGSILAVLEYQRMMVKRTSKDGVVKYDQSTTTTFRFGNGKTLRSLGIMTIRASVYGTTQLIDMHVVDTDNVYVPMLAGLDLLTTWEAKLNFQQRTLVTRFGALPLDRAGGGEGHFLLDLSRDLRTGQDIMRVDRRANKSPGEQSQNPREGVTIYAIKTKFLR